MAVVFPLPQQASIKSSPALAPRSIKDVMRESVSNTLDTYNIPFSLLQLIFNAYHPPPTHPHTPHHQSHQASNHHTYHLPHLPHHSYHSHVQLRRRSQGPIQAQPSSACTLPRLDQGSPRVRCVPQSPTHRHVFPTRSHGDSCRR